jgi:hypothetical protein
MLGLFPRTILVVAWIPFTMSLTIFQWREVVGHLPFYGALAILLIWTPSQDDARLWVKGVLGREPEPATPSQRQAALEPAMA